MMKFGFSGGVPGLAALAISVSVLLPCTSRAADYPVRMIRYTQASTGGPADIMARAFSEKLSQRTGQPVVVEARPGGGGLVSYQGGTSQSDGYWLFNATPATLAFPATLKAFTGSIETDLTLVAPLVTGRTATVGHATFPVKSMDELLAYMRANPGKVNVGTSSAFDLMQSVVFQSVTGAKFEVIRYSGMGTLQNAILAGEVHVAMGMASAFAKNMAGTNRVNILGTIGSTRDRLSNPDVPALGESANPQLRELAKYVLFQPVWIGVAVGGKTPRPIVESLHAHAREIVKDADFVKRMRDIGYEPVEQVPSLAESAAMLAQGVAEFNRVAKQAGIEPQ